MFKCGILGKQSRSGEKCHKVIVETRPKQYRHWDYENEEEWFTQGTEIVREVSATEEGKNLWDSWTPEQHALWVKETRGYG